MAALDRPSYMDFDFTRYFGSLTRIQFDLRLRAVYVELFLKIGESGGAIPDNPALLATFIGGGCTAADIEETIRLAGPLFVRNADGTISHRVVSEKLSEIRDRREAAAQAGKASGRARKAKNTGTTFEHRSNGVQDPLNGPLNQEGVSEGVREGSSRARAEVKPGAPSAPEDQPPLKFSPHPPTRAEAPLETATGFDPERLQRIIRGSRPSGPDDRDLRRPWVSKAFGNWFERLTISEKLAIGAAWEKENPGIGFDTGPIATTTRARPTNGSGEGVRVAAGAPARSEEGSSDPDHGPDFTERRETGVLHQASA